MGWLLEFAGNQVSPAAALLLLPIVAYLALNDFLPVHPRRHDEKDMNQ
ncbi:hypothetical protein [Leisingera sp. M523]|nr:hypothetical protein [Leisingera sp. M523]UWQ30481.1 hypothetical protein K3557_08115 [Leisingera sp. M523]